MVALGTVRGHCVVSAREWGFDVVNARNDLSKIPSQGLTQTHVLGLVDVAGFGSRAQPPAPFTRPACRTLRPTSGARPPDRDT